MFDVIPTFIHLLRAKDLIDRRYAEPLDVARLARGLSERGVTFLSEPTERPYGIEATLRDNSGNWFSMTERPGERAAR